MHSRVVLFSLQTNLYIDMNIIISLQRVKIEVVRVWCLELSLGLSELNELRCLSCAYCGSHS